MDNLENARKTDTSLNVINHITDLLYGNLRNQLYEI